MTMPDWKKPEDYAFIDKKTIGLQGIAWEFLRRNPKYSADYQSVLDGSLKDGNDNPSHMSYFLGLGPKKAIGFPHPEMKDDESEAQWIKRCIQERKAFPEFLPPRRYAMKKWGLHWGPGGSLPDPALDAKSLVTSPKFDFGTTPRILKDFEDWGTLKVIPPEVTNVDLPIEWDPSNVVVVFSVRESPKKQWKRIQPTLSAMHKDLLPDEKAGFNAKSQEHTWIEALRAWDAAEEQAAAAAAGKNEMSKVERAKIILSNFPDDPSLSNHLSTLYDQALHRAKEHIDWKYQVILQHNS